MRQLINAFQRIKTGVNFHRSQTLFDRQTVQNSATVQEDCIVLFSKGQSQITSKTKIEPSTLFVTSCHNGGGTTTVLPPRMDTRMDRPCSLPVREDTGDGRLGVSWPRCGSHALRCTFAAPEPFCNVRYKYLSCLID